MNIQETNFNAVMKPIFDKLQFDYSTFTYIEESKEIVTDKMYKLEGEVLPYKIFVRMNDTLTSGDVLLCSGLIDEIEEEINICKIECVNNVWKLIGFQ